MDADKARAILAEAKHQGIYEGPIPEDDKKAISESEDLVEMAQQAWDQYVRGPEVESLLRIANEEHPKPEPEAEKAPEPEPESSETEADPEPEGPSEETEEPADDLSKVEPWEGYDKEKVTDIVDGIDAAVKDYSEEDLTDLMGNIWAYEAAHKARKAVLKHLEEVAASLQGDDEPTPEPDPAPEGMGQQIGEGAPEIPKVEPQQEAPPQQPDDIMPDPEPEPEPEQKKGPPEEKKGPEEEIITPPKLKQDLPPEDDDEHQKLVEIIEKEIERERLHVPEPPAEDLPKLPEDYTKLTDKELQQLFMKFSAAAYYKGYMLERDERLTHYYRGWADELHNELLKAIEKYDNNGKQKTMTLLEAEISDDENVKKLRRRQRKHDTFASAHRRERDSLNKLCEAFSRLETMRQNEWERSGKQQRRS